MTNDADGVLTAGLGSLARMPSPHNAAAVLGLQRLVGNTAVSALLGHGPGATGASRDPAAQSAAGPTVLARQSVADQASAAVGAPTHRQALSASVTIGANQSCLPPLG